MSRMLIGIFVAMLALIAGLASSALANVRVALVIGNSAYEHVGRLPNPANDAADIGAVLTQMGFNVTEAADLDYNRMRLVLRDFADAVHSADVALIYYAGHGIEIDNTNYLVPVNAELKSDRDVEFEAVPLDMVLTAIEAAPGLKVVLLDACRNNPFLSSMTRSAVTRSIGRGLSGIEPGGVLVGYAARSGTVSQDGDGRNSPYAQALLRYIGEPGLEIGKMFRKVRDTVMVTTDGAQEPFTYGSLPGEDLYLVAPLQIAAVPAPTDPAEASIVAAYADAESASTLSSWNAFLETWAAHPDNRLVQLAMAKRDALRTEADKKARSASRALWLEPKTNPDGTPNLSADDRRLIQEALNYAGYDVGAPDGAFGPKTLAAISAARLRYGLSPGTHVDAALTRALPDAKATAALKSEKARIYDAKDLPEGVEPRLARAIAYFSLGHRKMRFGYYRGHLYIAVMEGFGIDFSSANRIASQVGGHLATITSREEDRFIYDLFSTDELFIHRDGGSLFGPMFGLYQVDRSHEPSGGWAWVTGETLNYRNFNPGNPDNFGGFQHYARYYGGGKGRPAQFWDDTGAGWGEFAAFIFEFD